MKFQSINKAYGVSPKILKSGKWLTIPETNIDFLVRPSTHHNKVKTALALKMNMKKKHGAGYEDRMYFDKAVQEDLAILLVDGEVIIDWRYTDTKDHGEDSELSVNDIVELFDSAPEAVVLVMMYAVNIKNFQVVEDGELKN